MATRGTYKIDGTLCYNHWDNYPSGAAIHLLKIIQKSGNVDLFSCVRGMDRLEIGQSVFDGPAEFHYKIDSKKGEIQVFAIGEGHTLRSIFFGSIKDFINTELNKAMKQHIARGETFFDEGETIEDIQVEEYPKNNYITKADARKKGNDLFNKGVEGLEKGLIGNSSSYFNDAFKYLNLAGGDENRRNEYLVKYAPVFVEKYNHKDSTYFESVVLSNFEVN